VRITDLEYLDKLRFLRHGPGHWQLLSDFRVKILVDGVPRTLTAPRGMMTDLASVPKILWSIAGPLGKHLEAAIIHDYLYMEWTDRYGRATRKDWNFADDVFRAGMKASGVGWLRRNLMYSAVHSSIGWKTFKTKPRTFSNRMKEWLARIG